MKQEREIKKIEGFWEWFITNEKKIKEVVENGSHSEKEALVDALDNQVLEFGLFKWEIGPGRNKSFFFTISPNGSQELLSISRSIMEAAPSRPDWDFHYALPEKDWDLKFSLYDDLLDKHDIDAIEWGAALMPLFNQKAVVVIEAPNISHLSHETQLEAGDVVITNQLGEAIKITHVKKIEVVSILPPENRDSRFPIQQLKQEMEKLNS